MFRPGADTVVSGPESGARPDPFSSINPEPFSKSEQNLHELWRTHRQAILVSEKLIGQGIIGVQAHAGFGFEFREILAQDAIIMLHRMHDDGLHQEICYIRIAHEGQICAWPNRNGRVALSAEEEVIIMESMNEIYSTQFAQQTASV